MRLCSLQEILIESTRTAEFSFMNTYLLPRHKRFVQVKQQSIMFNNKMCRLVIMKDVTKILQFRYLTQKNSKLLGKQEEIAHEMLNLIRVIYCGFQIQLQVKEEVIMYAYILIQSHRLKLLQTHVKTLNGEKEHEICTAQHL